MRAPRTGQPWNVGARGATRTAPRDPWPGIRWLWRCFVVGLLVVFARAIWLEMRDGSEYRALASKPTERRIPVAARRGAILARDGQPLAETVSIACAGVHYRWLEEPPNPSWLRRIARQRLEPRERRNRERIRAMEQTLLAERDELFAELQALCGVSPSEWEARRSAIQERVERVREQVNTARIEAWKRSQSTRKPDVATWSKRLSEAAKRILFPTESESPPEPIVIAEELQFHPLCEDLAPGQIEAIEALGTQHESVRVVTRHRRRYPHGPSAANLVGYCSPHDEADLAGESGRAGLEQRFDEGLRPAAGMRVEHLRRNGQLMSAFFSPEPRDGADVRLTIDLQLQKGSEALLLESLARRIENRDSGGAVVVMECATGNLLVAASGPSFDPNGFASGDVKSIQDSLTNSSHPLLDRTSQMQIPPGSVFKIVSALALLDAGIDPRSEYDCRGFWESPERDRCAIFARYGRGHGSLGMRSALAQSCNCYFFEHAARLAPGLLERRARDLGFGSPTGVELPSEVTGNLPSDGTSVAARQALAIGQSTLTVTPLQVARLMAWLTNGGRLVSPRLIATSDAEGAESSANIVADGRLAELRAGLVDAVESPEGTASGDEELGVRFAGKTGTAEVGEGQAEHSWFAGYAPVDHPEVVVVVALEHAGDAGASAVPIARRVLAQMERLGYFSDPERARLTWEKGESAAREGGENEAPKVRR